ncbi:uncharacterized protein RSE6_05615 [Rhynchosporium secalis]|nr:uncharacterized protein RSE6_05615 [Rhynchosporium secalis]
MGPTRSVFWRQRTPLLIATFFGGIAVFGALKWRAVFSRSESAKRATTRTKDINFSVDPGRSGENECPTSTL